MGELLKKSKLILRIEDDESDEVLKIYLNQGRAYLNRLAGGEVDYAITSNEELLLNYVRYAFNEARELFSLNFKDDIERFCLEYAVLVMNND